MFNRQNNQYLMYNKGTANRKTDPNLSFLMFSKCHRDVEKVISTFCEYIFKEFPFENKLIIINSYHQRHA